MKLKELFEDDDGMELDPTAGGGYKDNNRKDKTNIVSKLLRRKSDKNNPQDGDIGGPKRKGSDNEVNDADGDKRLGQGILSGGGTGLGA